MLQSRADNVRAKDARAQTEFELPSGIQDSFKSVLTVARASAASDAYDYSPYAGQAIVRAPLVEGIRELAHDNSTPESVLVDVMNPEGDGINVRVNKKGEAYLQSRGIEYHVVHSNVTAVIEAQRQHMRAHKHDDFFKTFRTNDEIIEFYRALATKYSEWVTFQEAAGGKTIEGRDIFVGKISIPKQGSEQRPVYLMGAALHGREWLAPMTLAYFLEHLLEQFTKEDPDATTVLHAMDIHFIPIVNPDGYVYSHEKSRYWRKNRRDNGDGTFGVDLNRNFGTDDWCKVGASRTSSKETYCGKAAFSEPEAAFYGGYMKNLGRSLSAFMDFHSYGSLLLRPDGEPSAKLPEEERNLLAGNVFVGAANKIHKGKFRSIEATDLYPTSGTTDTYAYAKCGIQEDGKRPYSWTVELAGDDFAVPSNLIIPSGEEIYAGQIAFIKYVIR